MEFIFKWNVVGLVSFLFQTQLSDTLPSVNIFFFLAFGKSKNKLKTRSRKQNTKLQSHLRQPLFSPVIYIVMLILNIQTGNTPLKYFFF